MGRGRPEGPRPGPVRDFEPNGSVRIDSSALSRMNSAAYLTRASSRSAAAFARFDSDTLSSTNSVKLIFARFVTVGSAPASSSATAAARWPFAIEAVRAESPSSDLKKEGTGEGVG